MRESTCSSGPCDSTVGACVAAELTALVVLAAVALGVIGVANAVRTVARMFELLGH